MLEWLKMYFSGWVIIHISGNKKEALLNLALQEGIDLYDIRILENGDITAKVYFRQIGAMRHLARSSGVTFRLYHRFGPLFIWRYLKKRKMLVAGFLFFLVSIYTLSSFVLFIQIDSKGPLLHMTTKTIEKAAVESGIAWGKYIPDLDLRQAEKAILLKLPELSWVGINRQGSMLHIQVAERKVAEPDADTAKLLIAAAKDGIIKDILVMQGEALVKRGDTVAAGQPLVLPKNGKARAMIMARVWYEGTGQCGETEEQKIDTGPLVKNWWLEDQKGKKLMLWGELPSEDWALVYEKEQALVIWQGIDLPCFIMERTYQPQKSELKNWGAAGAEEEAYARAVQMIRQTMPPESQLLKEEVIPLAQEGNIHHVKVVWECLEDIALISGAAGISTIE